MDRAALDALQSKLEEQVKEHFPDDGVQRVVLLQHGDDPQVEPGGLWVRVLAIFPRLMVLLVRSRQDCVPVSRICALKVTRSTIAATRRGSGKTVPHSLNGRLVPIAITARCRYHRAARPVRRPPGSAGGQVGELARSNGRDRVGVEVGELLEAGKRASAMRRARRRWPGPARSLPAVRRACSAGPPGSGPGPGSRHTCRPRSCRATTCGPSSTSTLLADSRTGNRRPA